jgi:hypothetical protein
MKNLTLIICLSVGLLISCTETKIQDAKFLAIENIEPTNLYKKHVWHSGLVDHIAVYSSFYTQQLFHRIASFKDISALTYGGSNITPKGIHYKLNNATTDLLFKTIKANLNEIDGIFVGVSESYTNNFAGEQLFISLVKIDSARQKNDPSCAIDVMTFYKPKATNKTVNFKYDKKLAIWTPIVDTDPIIVSFKAKKRGIFIGKDNLFQNIFRKNNIMYLYTGFNVSERHFVAVDYPYFSPITEIGSGTQPKEPFYLSTLKDIPESKCANAVNTNHGTSRLCPDRCPE